MIRILQRSCSLIDVNMTSVRRTLVRQFVQPFLKIWVQFFSTLSLYDVDLFLTHTMIFLHFIQYTYRYLCTYILLHFFRNDLTLKIELEIEKFSQGTIFHFHYISDSSPLAFKTSFCQLLTLEYYECTLKNFLGKIWHFSTLQFS